MGADGRIYMFKHDLLREAAYLLQLPSERARLHRLAMDCLEEVWPEEEREAVAHELADHATQALEILGSKRRPALRRKQFAYLRMAARHATNSHLLQQSLNLWQRVARHGDAAPEDRVQALLNGGNAALLCGQAETGRLLLDECARLAAEAGFKKEAANAMSNLVQHFLDAARMSEAKELLDRLLALAESDDEVELLALMARARWHDVRGETDAAEHEYRRCMERALLLGDEGVAGRMMTNLGGLLAESSRSEEAREVLERGRDLLKRIGDRRVAAVCGGNLGWVAQLQGRLDDAEAYLKDSAKTAAGIGSRHDEAVALGNLGNVYLNRGDYVRSVETHMRAIMLHREVGNRRFEGIVLGDSAVGLFFLDRLGESEQRVCAAIKIHEETANRRSGAVCLCLLGRIRVKQRRTQEGEALLRQAIKAAEEAGDRAWSARGRRHLAEVLQSKGCGEDAREALAQARAILMEIGADADIREIDELLAAIG